MGRKSLFLIATIFVLGTLLTGCGTSGGDEGQLSSELLKTEKTLPNSFYEIAEQGIIAFKITNQNEFNEQWNYFGLTEIPSEIDWDNKVAIFLGIFESGSCPLEFESVDLNEEKTNLIFYVEGGKEERACTDDATPRTIVIAVDAAEVSDVNFVEINNYHGANPRVEFYE